MGKLVCSCGNVGEGNITGKIKEGHTTLDQLCQVSGAGLGCGSCKPEIQAILERASAGAPALEKENAI
jgi:ferredoxin-nitrate reductase